MKLFRLLAEKHTESKFRRNGWRIVESLPAADFAHIIETYRDDGWEFSDAYRSFDGALDKWRCKLRKGTSTLHCQWTSAQKGRIYGPSRPVGGLGKSFNLPVLNTPSRQ